MEIRTEHDGGARERRAIELSGGEVVPTRTVTWTAGVKPHPVVARLGLPLDDGGRIRADRYCRVAGLPGVWAIGDAAAVPDPAHKDRPSPPTAQHVLRQGKVVGDNVAAALAGDGGGRPFRYRTLGVFVDMGRKKAVASTLGIRWRGFPAWFLARTYHLAQMPGNRAPRAPGRRLDGRPAVRPRLGRARPARAPARRSAATSCASRARAARARTARAEPAAAAPAVPAP